MKFILTYSIYLRSQMMPDYIENYKDNFTGSSCQNLSVYKDAQR